MKYLWTYRLFSYAIASHLYVWVLRKTWQKCDRFFVAIFMVECSWCVSCIYTIYILLSGKSFFHRISISSVSSIEYLLWCASKTSQSSTLVSLQYLKELNWEALFRKLFLKLFNSKDIKINKFLVVLLWLWGGGWFFLNQIFSGAYLSYVFRWGMKITRCAMCTVCCE